MSSRTVLHGFDARVPMQAEDPAWTAERRARFLLRLDVARPLSVDCLVWSELAAARPTDSVLSSYWLELDELRRACRAAGLGPGSATLVAVAVCSDDPLAAEPILPCVPAEPEASWQLLGYDVADRGLISGLSNCGYLPELDDVDALRSRFGPLLDEHGLFTHRDHAEAFRLVSDRRVAEHAPFLVHALFAVPW